MCRVGVNTRGCLRTPSTVFGIDFHSTESLQHVDQRGQSCVETIDTIPRSSRAWIFGDIEQISNDIKMARDSIEIISVAVQRTVKSLAWEIPSVAHSVSLADIGTTATLLAFRVIFDKVCLAFTVEQTTQRRVYP